MVWNLLDTFYLPGLCICFDLFNQILSLVFGAKIGRADFFTSVLLGLIAPLALVITSGTARSPRVQSLASLLIVWGDSLGGI